MQRDSEWDITIPLSRVKQSQVGTKEEYFQIVHERYTTQYLERLGVEPTERHRKLVARHSPLEECNIETSWGEDSAVANKLRIIQPPIGPSSRGDFIGEASQKVDGEGASLNRELEKHAYISAVPPDILDAATVSQMVGQVGHGHFDHKVVADRERERAFMAMQCHDVAASEGANVTLIEELERARRRARGEDARDNDPVLMQWGEEGMNELKGLKHKFILPFAAEKPVRGGAGGIVLESWQSPALQAGQNIQVPRDLVADVLEPVKIKLVELMEEAVKYSENRLPLELLTTRDDPWLFAAVRERLGSQEAIRLTGLLAHLLYWTVFGHLHDPSKRLPELTRQSLLLTIQELWSRLVEPARQKLGRRGELLARDSPAGISFVLPVFILALKRGVDWVFLRQYPRVFSDPDYGADLSRQLVNQLNLLMMNIFDPDNAYASFGALDSSMEAIRLWRKLSVLQLSLGLTPSTKMLGREYRTTPMVLLLMNGDGGGPNNAKTRKMLQKSSSDTVLAAVAGIPPEQTPQGNFLAARVSSRKIAPHLPEQKRATLYRTACNRLQSSGLAQLKCSTAGDARSSSLKARKSSHRIMTAETPPSS